MIKTVLFVHGTGVRKAAYESSAALFSRALAQAAPGVALQPCLWGDTLGARLPPNPGSIPDFSAVVPTEVSADQVLALWDLLRRDPLFELRELAAAPAGGLEPPAEKQRKQAFATKLRGLAQTQLALAALDGRALAVQWQQAVSAVADDGAFAAALAASPSVATPLRVASSHAVVAALQQQLADDHMPVLPHRVRDEMVELCVAELGGRELGVKDWITDRLVGFG